MEINFCTPSFFFNTSQKFPFLVYDFRDQLSGSLKNTVKCQYVSQIQFTAEMEEYFQYPETPSEKKKLQTLFKNRKRNFNFLVLYASSDMFTLFLYEQLRKECPHTDKFQVSEALLLEWCELYMHKYTKQQKRQPRAQTTRVQKQSHHHPQSQANIEEIQPSNRRAYDYDYSQKQEIDEQHFKRRFASAPHKLTLESEKPSVSNFDLFTMAMCVYNSFASEKFRSVYIFIEPLDIIFRNYPFLNYDVQRNKYFLDKSFPNEIIENQLYLGAAEHAKDVEMLEDQLKITHVLNVTIEVKNYSQKLNYCHIQIYDEPQVKISDHFDTAYEYIDTAIANGGKVLVHCAQGKSRSACMVTMYLMRKFSWTFNKAYEFVQDRREVVCINDGFIEQLQSFI